MLTVVCPNVYFLYENDDIASLSRVYLLMVNRCEFAVILCGTKIRIYFHCYR